MILVLLTTYSFCFLSDDLTHDVGFVYALQKKLTQYIHVNFPQINFIEYFSDGCSDQYKNYKNFLNLTYHKHDFGIGASWSLFATSHGKSPCDGIGGMVKRKLMRESLMRPVNHQLLSVQAVFFYCKESISGIAATFCISKEELTLIRSLLKERHALANTVPGTRSFHHFASDDVGILKFFVASTPFPVIFLQ